MIPQTTTSIKGQAGGLALVRKYGHEHMRDIGRLGGHPRALTIDDIKQSIAPAAQKSEKEESHRKGLKELLRLWKQKQACSKIIAQEQACCQLAEAAGGKEGLGFAMSPYSPRPVCRPERNREPGSLLLKELTGEPS